MQRDSWQAVRDRLAEDIANGKFAPGTQLPTEPQLCEVFGVGRHSVRRAVSALAVEGKLRVEQGRGTFVETVPLITYQIGRRTRFRQNLLEQGITPKGEHISAVVLPAPARVAVALEIPEGTSVHRLLRRGLADGVPINLGMAFHPVSLFPDLAERRANGVSITDIYRNHGIADYFRKRTTIFTRRPEPDEARLLSQHIDHPVMVVTKTDVTADGRAIGYSEAVWAGDRVQFSFDGLDDTDAAPDGQERNSDDR